MHSNTTKSMFYNWSLIFFILTYFISMKSVYANTNFSNISDDKNYNVTSTPRPSDLTASFAEQMFQRDRTSFDFSKKYTLTCSIFSFFRDGIFPKMHVYSTYRVDHCSPSKFQNITAASAKAQLKVIDNPSYVKISTPRVQLMDINSSPMTKQFFSIGSLKFSQIASSALKFRDVLSIIFGNDIFLQYRPLEIISDTHYLWHAGSTVYALTDSEGTSYIMTHAATRDSIKSESDLKAYLENLSEHVKAPQGWTYRSFVLRTDYSVFSDSKHLFGKKFLMDGGYNMYIESINLPN